MRLLAHHMLLKACLNRKKINVAALGNMVPQLHIHIVGRFKEDMAWPGPIWGRIPPDPRDSHELDAIKAKLVAFDFGPRP